jgi:pyruvate,water dikinase
LRILPRVLYWCATSARGFFRNLIPRWRDERLPAYLATIERWKAIDRATATDAQLLSGVRELTTADAIYWFNVAYVMGMAKITDDLLNRFLTSRAVRGDLTSGLFLRGFPSATLQAQEDLEAIARQTHSSDELHDLLVTTPSADLLEALSQHPAGQTTLADIHRYLDRYGHQIYNLDFVQPTQAEDPLPVLMSLKALVNNPAYDTRRRQAEMARDRESRVDQTLKSLGPLRRWLFRKFLGWAQRYGPYREQSLFYVGAAWPTLRGLALEIGERLVLTGALNAPDDVFYLNSGEIIDACDARSEGRMSSEIGPAASRRRDLREARKKLHPPGNVPPGSRWKIGPLDLSAWETQKRNADDCNTLNGFAVSPGKVSGPASVILSPADFAEMKPDTILVCPTTTPAWTPLFAQALGLVTDIGGVLAHGSIVAREYGIPAVMGTGNVTQRIVTGQRISVDGDTGTVTLLSEA